MSRNGLVRALAPAWQSRTRVIGLLLAAAALLSACSGMGFSTGDIGSAQAPAPGEGTQQASAIGSGQVKVGLILPLSATGNAGLAAQSMRNSAEMALTEFNNPNIQLLVKDDGGSTQ